MQFRRLAVLNNGRGLMSRENGTQCPFKLEMFSLGVRTRGDINKEDDETKSTERLYKLGV